MKRTAFPKQLRVLFARYLRIQVNDFTNLLLAMGLGLGAGWFLQILPPDAFLKPDNVVDATLARQSVTLFVILVVAIGAFGSYREISKEFTIYLHERRKGLDTLAYVFSKMIWLTFLIGFLSTSLILSLNGITLLRWVLVIAILLYGVVSFEAVVRDLSQLLIRSARMAILAILLVIVFFFPAQFMELPTKQVVWTNVAANISITLILVATTSVALGLMISSIVKQNTDRATYISIGLIVFNVIMAFSELIFRSGSEESGKQLATRIIDTAKLASVSHWGYSSFSSALDIYCWANEHRFENFNSAGHILSSWFYLLLAIVLALGLAVFFLHMRETWHTFTQKLRANVLQKASLTFFGFMVLLLSLGTAFRIGSQAYHTLTFSDLANTHGAPYYASIDNAGIVSGRQYIDGVVNQSACTVGYYADDLETRWPVFVAQIRNYFQQSPVPSQVSRDVGIAERTPAPSVAPLKATQASGTPTTQGASATPRATPPNRSTVPPTPTSTATQARFSPDFPGLPTTRVLQDVEALTQPRYLNQPWITSIGTIPANTQVTIFTIDKSNLVDKWFRVLWVEDESYKLGWVRAAETDYSRPEKLEDNATVAPPTCAKPLMDVVGLGSDWISPVTGRIAFVIDVFRPDRVNEASVQLSTYLNGDNLGDDKSWSHSTSGAILIRSIVIEVKASEGDNIEFRVDVVPETEIETYVIGYELLSDCSFGN